MTEQENYQLIEHTQRSLALDAPPLARASAKRPYKLRIQFHIGYLHTTYHATEEEACAAYRVMLEVFGDTAIDVERSGDVEQGVARGQPRHHRGSLQNISVGEHSTWQSTARPAESPQKGRMMLFDG